MESRRQEVQILVLGVVGVSGVVPFVRGSGSEGTMVVFESERTGEVVVRLPEALRSCPITEGDEGVMARAVGVEPWGFTSSGEGCSLLRMGSTSGSFELPLLMAASGS